MDKVDPSVTSQDNCFACWLVINATRLTLFIYVRFPSDLLLELLRSFV